MSAPADSESDSRADRANDMVEDDKIELDSPPPSLPPAESLDAVDRELMPPPARPSPKQSTIDFQAQVQTSENVLEEADANEPEEELASFDWRLLHERYHASIEDIKRKEQSIMIEFGELCNYFSTWIAAGSNREIDRSFKRLETQTALVRHHEYELGERRLHYIKVVSAFKDALHLLNT